MCMYWMSSSIEEELCKDGSEARVGKFEGTIGGKCNMSSFVT